MNEPDRGRQVSTEPDPKKAEMIRDSAPHPWELAGVVSESYDYVDDGKWIFFVQGGWYEDVVNGLWMEGYLIRSVRAADGDTVKITVIEERRLSTSVCIGCGERVEPEHIGGNTHCPACGGTV